MSRFFTIIGFVQTGIEGREYPHHIIGPVMGEGEIYHFAGINPKNRPAALSDAIAGLNQGKRVFKAFEDDPAGHGRINFIAAADKIGRGKEARELINSTIGFE